MEEIASQIEDYLRKEQQTELTTDEETRLSDLYRTLLDAMCEGGIA